MRASASPAGYRRAFVQGANAQRILFANGWSEVPRCTSITLPLPYRPRPTPVVHSNASGDDGRRTACLGAQSVRAQWLAGSSWSGPQPSPERQGAERQGRAAEDNQENVSPAPPRASRLACGRGADVGEHPELLHLSVADLQRTDTSCRRRCQSAGTAFRTAFRHSLPNA
jgi:hypothetical protein